MAVALPQLPRAHHADRKRGLLRHDGGSTSLPVLPRVLEQGLVPVHELRHVHRHYHIAIGGALEPLQEAAVEVDSEPPGSPKSSPSRPKSGSSRQTPARRGSRQPLRGADAGATMDTAEMLLGAELPGQPGPTRPGSGSGGSLASGAAGQEESRPRRKSQARSSARRSLSAAAGAEEPSEAGQPRGRAASLSEASAPVLSRRPLWSRAPTGDQSVERRMRELDAEGQWLQERGEFKKKLRALPDSSCKRKLVGDPRLRNVSDAAVVEKIKQEDIARSRQAARSIRGAMQDCSKSRQQLKNMQMMLRGAESEELQRQKAAAAVLLQGRVPSDGATTELA